MPQLVFVAYAQVPSIGFAVDKGVYDFDIVPGTSASERITIANELTDLPLPVRVEMTMWDLAADADQIEYVIPEQGRDATRWFQYKDDYGNYRSLNGANFILPADGRKDVDLRVLIPTVAEFGSYLVAMRVQAVVPDFYFAKDGPRFLPEIAILFFVNARPLSLESSDSYNAEIVTFGPAVKQKTGEIISRVEASVFDKAVNYFLAQVRNTGSYHFQAEGRIEVRNIFGRLVESREVPPRYLIPNRVRNLQLTTGEAEGFFEKYAYLGRYTASLILSIPGDESIASSTVAIANTAFWIFPWQLIVVIALVAVVLLMGWKYRKRISLFFKTLFA